MYTNPSRATIPLIRPHQCDSEGGRIRGVLLYSPNKLECISSCYYHTCFNKIAVRFSHRHTLHANTTSPTSSQRRTYKWDKLRRGRHALGNKKHEYGERQQDSDTKRHLLARVSRKPEPEQAEHGQPQARENDVEQVVESAPAHHYRERHIRVRLDAASVSNLIPLDADVE